MFYFFIELVCIFVGIQSWWDLIPAGFNQRQHNQQQRQQHNNNKKMDVPNPIWEIWTDEDHEQNEARNYLPKDGKETKDEMKHNQEWRDSFMQGHNTDPKKLAESLFPGPVEFVDE